MSLRQQVSDYLLNNQIDRTKPNPYNQAAAKFNVSTELVRSEWRKLRNKGLVESKGLGNVLVIDKNTPNAEKLIESWKSSQDSAEIIKDTYERVKTLEDLIRVCEIDTETWEITSWECNKWEVGAKNDDNKVEVTPLFQVKAKLKRRNLDTDLGLQKDLIIKELKEYSPEVMPYRRDDSFYEEGECLLEIALFDAHFGKMANKGESEGNYDLKIAEKEYNQAVDELLGRVNLKAVNKILLPIGNDLLHIDNIKATTFNGTPLETDTRFHKLIKTVRRILIETIDRLSVIAPVDVVVVVGNHDTTASFLMGEILDAWYAKNENVKVDNSPKLRKYYKFGKNGFQFTHGDQEKHSELGLIFATEQPKLWASTRFHFCQLGHLHKKKKTNYVSVDSYQGFQVQILPSISSQDRWHYANGYISLKQAMAFLYHPEEGLIGEFTVTL